MQFKHVDKIPCGWVQTQCDGFHVESDVASENDPVDNGSEESVARCAMGKARYVVEHAVRDHLLSFGYWLVFLENVGNYFHVN